MTQDHNIVSIEQLFIAAKCCSSFTLTKTRWGKSDFHSVNKMLKLPVARGLPTVIKKWVRTGRQLGCLCANRWYSSCIKIHKETFFFFLKQMLVAVFWNQTVWHFGHSPFPDVNKWSHMDSTHCSGFAWDCWQILIDAWSIMMESLKEAYPEVNHEPWSSCLSFLISHNLSFDSRC